MSHLERAADIIRRVAARTAQNEPSTSSPVTPLLSQDPQAPKKKCRGDRRRQRYRRQFYAQGLDPVTVERLVKEKMTAQVQQRQGPVQGTDRTTSQEPFSRNLRVSIPLDRVSDHRCIVRV